MMDKIQRHDLLFCEKNSLTKDCFMAVQFPSFHTAYPLNKEEQRIQKKADDLNEVIIEGQQDENGAEMTPNWDQRVKAKIGDVKKKYTPSFTDRALGGNMQIARKHWFMATQIRAYHYRNAKSFFLSSLTSCAALPAKVYESTVHFFVYKGDDKSELLERDWRDITDAFTCMSAGTFYGLANGAYSVLRDPVMLVCRFINRKFIDTERRAGLLIVDPQFDFFPEAEDIEFNGKHYSVPAGALPVAGAWGIIPVIRNLQKSIHKGGGWSVGTVDDHPIEPKPHGSFGKVSGIAPYQWSTLNGKKQMMWPVHCVHGSRGWQYVPGLIHELIVNKIYKGQNPLVDSYSAYYDNDGVQKTLATEYLRDVLGVTDVFVAGVALDYCVGFSALDARKEGFKVTVISDATVGTNQPDQEDNEKTTNEVMIEKFKENGIRYVTSDQLIGKSKFFPALEKV
jgi:nicotinamidase/pyrazinamidase